MPDESRKYIRAVMAFWCSRLCCNNQKCILLVMSYQLSIMGC